MFALNARYASNSVANALVKPWPLITARFQGPAGRSRADAAGRRSCRGSSILRWRGRALPRSSAAEPLRPAAGMRHCGAATGFPPSAGSPPLSGTSQRSPGAPSRDRPAGCVGLPNAGIGDHRRSWAARRAHRRPACPAASAGNGSVSGLPVFCCTIPIVCPRQSTSPIRSATMSQARNPVDNASKVIAASRALTTPAAQARTTSSSSASSKTGTIA